MEQENYNVEQPEKKGLSPEGKALLIKYAVCFGVASLITFIIFWVKGFFTDNTGVNIQILSDGFFVSGVLMTLFAAGIVAVDQYTKFLTVQNIVPYGHVDLMPGVWA